jgi:hypothetical protein
MSTVVLESHGHAGGCAGYFRKRGYSFDVGATTLVDFEPGGVGAQFPGRRRARPGVWGGAARLPRLATRPDGHAAPRSAGVAPGTPRRSRRLEEPPRVLGAARAPPVRHARRGVAPLRPPRGRRAGRGTGDAGRGHRPRRGRRRAADQRGARRHHPWCGADPARRRDARVLAHARAAVPGARRRAAPEHPGHRGVRREWATRRRGRGIPRRPGRGGRRARADPPPAPARLRPPARRRQQHVRVGVRARRHRERPTRPPRRDDLHPHRAGRVGGPVAAGVPVPQGRDHRPARRPRAAGSTRGSGRAPGSGRPARRVPTSTSRSAPAVPSAGCTRRCATPTSAPCRTSSGYPGSGWSATRPGRDWARWPACWGAESSRRDRHPRRRAPQPRARPQCDRLGPVRARRRAAGERARLPRDAPAAPPPVPQPGRSRGSPRDADVPRSRPERPGVPAPAVVLGAPPRRPTAADLVVRRGFGAPDRRRRGAADAADVRARVVRADGGRG